MRGYVPGRKENGEEEVAGFITVRVVSLRECDAQDRALLGLDSHLLDRQVLFQQHGLCTVAPLFAAARATFAKIPALMGKEP